MVDNECIVSVCPNKFAIFFKEGQVLLGAVVSVGYRTCHKTHKSLGYCRGTPTKLSEGMLGRSTELFGYPR